MYQALYRKYRPQTFDDVVGQGSITRILRTQVVTGKLSHAYLFTGSRGTGKTTCSKILAKAVNCLNPVDGNPCNCCSACRSIDDGSCTDVLEIDAASNNGVDNVRSLRDDAIYTPAEVKKRVYIIDEVHMLSISAFNALLKIIEEPPEHLMFILATTELHKVPATILSRCQRFSFRRISPEDVTARIHYVAYEEGIAIEPTAASLLGVLADGALRDGLSLLDQCAAATQGPLTVDAVCSCLGIAGIRKAADLLTAVAEKHSGAALQLLAEQYAEGKDLGAFVDELLSVCRDLLLLKTAPGAGRNMLSGISTEEALNELLPRFSAGELLRHIKLLQQTAAGFQRSASRRVDVELCLLQMCDPTLDLDAEALNARLSRIEEAMVSGLVPAAPAAKEEGPKAETALEKETPAPPNGKPSETKRPAAMEPAEDTLPIGFWADLVMKVKPELTGSAGGFFSAGQNTMLEPHLRGDLLEIAAATDFVKRAVDDERTRTIITQKASALLQKPIRVRFCLREEDRGRNDSLEELIRLGRQRPDIFHIKET